MGTHAENSKSTPFAGCHNAPSRQKFIERDRTPATSDKAMEDSFPSEESRSVSSQSSSALLDKIQDAWHFLLTQGHSRWFRMVLKESSLDRSCMEFLLCEARGLPEDERLSKILVRQTPSGMSDGLIDQFVEFIALNQHSLEDLSLTPEFESVNGAHAHIHPQLLTIIPRLSNLNSLLLERCNLADDSTRTFISEFFCPISTPTYGMYILPKRHQTAKLTLRDCTIDEETIRVLGRALESYSGLKEVTLQGLEMPTGSADALLNALVATPSDLRLVELISMGLENNSLPLLASLLQRHTNLRTFDLDWNFRLFANAANSEFNKGLKMFSQSLSTHTRLKELNMEECSISDSELTLLLRGLEENHCLETFHMASNFGLQVGDWIDSFAKLSIHSLNLSDSLALKIPQADQDRFLSALSKNTSLKECILHWTGIKWQKVDIFLRRNHVLEKVQELSAYPQRKRIGVSSWPIILQHIGNFGDASSVQLFMKIMREEFLLAHDT